jgi:predicted MFS family arabinose efflux permease
MLPLVGDLAPPHRRSTALSIVVSGMLLGMLIARLLSGVVTELIGWRYIYWIAFGLQYLILILLFLFMPDYPSTNPDMGLVRKYPSLLLDILRMPFKYPVLVQACLIGFFTASTFTSYWTTLTFLLAGSPYHYSSLVIGLFALAGIGSMTWGPIFARTVMEKHEPLFSILIGETICLGGVIIGTYTGIYTVTGPIIQAACIDIGLQTSQIANRTAIFGVEPKGRNRINTAYMVSVFCGQLMGTAAGNHLYAQGGWTKSGSANVGFVCAALVICLLRGPHEQGWVGWGGGCKMRKARVVSQPQKDEAKGVGEEHTRRPFATDQGCTDKERDDIERGVLPKTSGPTVSCDTSEKTLTVWGDDSSTRNATKKAEGNAT